jgi:acyl-CoA synthetase (AMP-forming)/AMP-acid ligase II
MGLTSGGAVIHRSRITEIEIPDVSLSEHVLRGAAARGDKPALVDALTGEVLTYGQLAEQSAAGAAGLEAAGIGAGDVVSLMSHNQPQYAVAVHAIMLAGAVMSPLNPVLTVEEVAKQLRHSRSRALVVAEPVAAKGLEAARIAGVENVYVLGEHPGCRPFADLLAGPEAPPAFDLDPRSALAALPYSSGTTGLPKGVMLTHRNLVANLEQFRIGWRISEEDVFCAALPFFHIYGLMIILNSGLLAGATIVTLPRFDLRQFLAAVQEHRVTRGHLAPPLVLALAEAPEAAEYDLSSMRTAVSGAAPLDEDLAARAQERTGCMIRQGYGMTEASPGIHFVHDDDFAATAAGSVGRLMPATEARMVDLDSGLDVSPGEPGELLVRGPQVMAGYLGDPDATAATIVDGWLRTGDVACVDADGDFTIVDRVKELIKYKGYQVPPAELEALLLTHPDIIDAAVIGVPDRSAGEIPKAFVVAREALDAESVMAWVDQRVAPYKRVRAVEFVEQIPKSPAGKILRRVLRAQGSEAGAPR